jgi:tetratricopeptide (TPR) repeat protein
MLGNLSMLYSAQQRYSEAESIDRQVLETRERVLGPEHPDTLISITNLGGLYGNQKRYPEAVALFQRALAASEKTLGREHPTTLIVLDNLAIMQAEQKNFAAAIELWRRGTASFVSRSQRAALETRITSEGRAGSENEKRQGQFWRLLKVLHHHATESGGQPDAVVTQEAFQLAQWAISSEAARSLTQMAARGAKGNAALEKQIRERQDLVGEWRKRDEFRMAALGRKPEERNGRAEAENGERLAAISKRISEIDAALATAYPDYAALANPEPLSVSDIQALLGADEALVLFLGAPATPPLDEETFIWAVTRTEVRWVRSDLGPIAIEREVAALRCGLDRAAWHAPDCGNLIKVGFSQYDERQGKPLPFDHARSHRLYKALFGEIGDLIKGKQLLIAASGALTRLPLQVLVTAAPTGDDNRSAKWLVRDHALTGLPAVSSLKALRRVGRRSAAVHPMIGFGNPLLDGPDERFAEARRLAAGKQRCRETPQQWISGLFGWRGVPAMAALRGLANISIIRSQAPLPETADELCAVARYLDADTQELRLGARATESEVKALSANGQLAQYRIVHFATHGAMAGELNSGSEPGLILTPPADAGEEVTAICRPQKSPA